MFLHVQNNSIRGNPTPGFLYCKQLKCNGLEM